MTPIERAARELCLRGDVDPDSSLGGDGQNFLWMEYAELKVKPVLLAMWEPSEVMQIAGTVGGFSGYYGDSLDNRIAAREVWQAMIDAAIAELP